MMLPKQILPCGNVPNFRSQPSFYKQPVAETQSFTQRMPYVCSSSKPGASPPGDSTRIESNGLARTGPSPPGNIFRKILNFFDRDRPDKERVAELGMGASASYGAISYITYCICLVILWLSFVKATGYSPFAPECEWKEFLPLMAIFYAELWIVQNFVRPLRFSLALALAPFLDKFITLIGNKTGLPKTAAFVVCLIMLAILTTGTFGAALYFGGGFPGLRA